MKLQFKGKVGRQEILEEVSRLLNTLEDLGVDNFSSVNLYFTPRQGNKSVTPLIDDVAFSPCHKSKSKHISSEKNTETGVQTIKYAKGVMISDMDLEKRFSNVEISLKTKAEIDDDNELVRLKEESERMHLKHLLDEQFKEFKKNQDEIVVIEDNCLLKISEIYRLSLIDLKPKISSVGWIVCKKRILKHSRTITEDEVYRITLKADNETPKKIYLFSASSEVIFES